MKKKPKVVQKTWILKTKIAAEVKAVATLEAHELAMFIINMNECDGLRRALGRAEGDNKALWDRAAEKYGFEKGAYSHSVNLKTGEITKLF